MSVEPLVPSCESRERGFSLLEAVVAMALTLFVLWTDLAASLGDEVPSSLRDLARPNRPELVPRSRDLSRTWRNRRDLQRAYVDRSIAIEKHLNLGTPAFSLSGSPIVRL